MGTKIVVGPINKGFQNNVLPFNIDNDSFPTLINAYQWRGRVKRKRGTAPLCRLKRFIGTTDAAGDATITILPVTIDTGQVSFTIGTDIFTDPGTTANPFDQVLITNGAATTHTLNRVTGLLTIKGSLANTSVIYYPTLPVMGLEDLNLFANVYPRTVAFDTKYSYEISTSLPYDAHDVSFYKNPAADAVNLPLYVPKGPPNSTWTPVSWNGGNYQQFWTVCYQGAMWATNGISLINGQFDTSTMGMQFAPSASITFVSRTATTIVVNIAGSPLVVGDFVFLNEWSATTPANAATLNFQTGYVTSIVGPNITINLPFAALAVDTYAPGIIQYLTNRSNVGKDCIRWYDGDPTAAASTTQTFVEGRGWVNFMPPLSQFTYSISDLPQRQYYLVGCRMIVPFKDRLLFLGAVVQASSGDPIYLEDTIVYSQNGTAYYTASFTGNPVFANTLFHPILVPINQTSFAAAYFSDQTGFGGWIQGGVQAPMTTCSTSKDVLIIGFDPNLQTKLIYSGDDVSPFNFFIISSELGSSSTFSGINIDKGIMTVGRRGFILTDQTSASRIDMAIPDEVFEIARLNNGAERVCSQRDFINEWCYFTYPVDNVDSTESVFPTQTLMYNYREDTWSVNYETYTTYGAFNKQTGFTWATVGRDYPSWKAWNVPWNAGSSSLLEPEVIAGNQQGFVVTRDDGTEEANSLVIQAINTTTVTSPFHSLNEGDFIIISGAQGTISPYVNSRIFQITNVTTSSFQIDLATTGGTYLGGGLIKRIYRPVIQTKQFPLAWDGGRKTRLGVQQYLLSKTEKSQIQLLIFLSQNGSDAYNTGTIIPDNADLLSNALIYSTILYTCPESDNLGLSVYKSNLNMPGAIKQSQIWHRINTSLIGDTVQLGFTLSDKQMRSLDTGDIPYTITGVTLGTTTTLLTNGQFDPGLLILIEGMAIGGTVELNGNTYAVISFTLTQTVIDVNSLAFTPYTTGGTATVVYPLNQFAEIELHGFIMDCSPSMVLA